MAAPLEPVGVEPGVAEVQLPRFGGIESRLQGGKIANLFRWKRGKDVVVWDADVTLEGGALLAKLPLGEDARQALLDHPWPGNVRELENTVRRASVIASGPMITADDLRLGDAPTTATSTASPPPTRLRGGLQFCLQSCPLASSWLPAGAG